MLKPILVSSVSENLNKVNLRFHVGSFTMVLGRKGKKSKTQYCIFPEVCFCNALPS